MKSRWGWILIAAAGLARATPAAAELPWSWAPAFTKASAPGLTQLHGALVGLTLKDLGVPVSNVRWTSEGIEIAIESGAVWLEPEVDGVRPGAYFEGKATVKFSPSARLAKGDMNFWFGQEGLESVALDRAYFFTTREKNPLEELGGTGAPSVNLPDPARYLECKKTFRQLGLQPLSIFLNRAGRSKNAALVLLPLPLVRTSQSPYAALLYAFDPNEEDAVQLAAFAHEDVVSEPTLKHFFWSLVRARSATGGWQPAARVTEYVSDLGMPKKLTTTDLATTLRLTPSAGVRALALTLNPRMEVSAVEGAGGAALPFTQWGFLGSAPNPDPVLLVDLGTMAAEGQPLEIKVRAAGPMFDAFGSNWVLADEDTWYPQLDDQERHDYELTVHVPKSLVVAAPGKKLQDDVAEGVRTARFRTTRPQKRVSLYLGPFEIVPGQADNTKLEVYSDRNRPSAVVGYDTFMDMEVVAQGTSKNDVDYSRQELENAIKIFNRILGPLDLAELRVAATPTDHGRGFEGLLLLSKFGGFSSNDSRADLFRAHEVAHLWWGNMVGSRHWPEDRWLDESFAEYMAMEFYTLRFKKPEQTRTWMQQQWIKPILDATKTPIRTLDGQSRRVRSSELRPLIDGTQNVYTKGPLVIHMLRNLFVVFKKSDEPFWTMLQEFLEKNKGKPVSTDEFIAATEAKLGGAIPWFWDQWLYGSELPTIKWSATTQADGKEWVVTVDAQQEGTAFSLVLPIYVELPDGRKARQFLDLSKPTGRSVMRVPAKPKSISVNDNFEVLAMVEKE